MIYSPNRFCFIHIPRTGGNSITAALTQSCIGNHDLLVATGPRVAGPWRRHATAMNLVRVIPEWDDLYRFAVYREPEQIVESNERLIERDIKSGKLDDPLTSIGYKLLLRAEEQDRWSAKINDYWAFWCLAEDGSSLGVEKILFTDLTKRWAEICEKCKVDYFPLPHLNAA